jgi:hypothetical protein
METINYLGWPDSVRLSNSVLELVVVKEIGPRIMHLSPLGGENLLWIDDDLKGKAGPADKWVNYGGHRLWHGPELIERTYEPDNVPATVKKDGDGYIFTAPPEGATGIQKALKVTLASGSTPVVTIDHFLTNCSKAPFELAPWELTVVAHGGRVIIPHEPYAAHGQDDHYLPSRPLILWPFTDMSDPRWTWGKNFIQLKPDAALGDPQKLGAYVTEGWGAYTRPSGVTLFTFVPPPTTGPETYIDFGSNFETFAKGAFQELETLGPLMTLQPGETLSHRVTWFVETGTPLPTDDAGLRAAIPPILAKAAKVIGQAS